MASAFSPAYTLRTADPSCCRIRNSPDLSHPCRLSIMTRTHAFYYLPVYVRYLCHKRIHTSPADGGAFRLMYVFGSAAPSSSPTDSSYSPMKILTQAWIQLCQVFSEHELRNLVALAAFFSVHHVERIRIHSEVVFPFCSLIQCLTIHLIDHFIASDGSINRLLQTFSLLNLYCHLNAANVGFSPPPWYGHFTTIRIISKDVCG
jgi:hypothetical protein